MVLIRKQYFKKHCEMVMREYQAKHRVRGVWNNLAKRSFRRTVSKAPGVQLKGPTGEEEPMSPEEPVVATGEGIVAALVGGAGVGIGVGIGPKAFQDAALDGRIVNGPLENVLPDREPVKQGIVADAHSFTSSPRSIVASLRPVSPASQNGTTGVRWNEQSPKPHQARVDRNYMRKRASMSTWSLRSLQITLTIIPARQFTVMTQNTDVSGPPRRKDQDMGGFPGPIELFQRLIHTNAFGSIDRTWNRIVTDWRTHRQRRYLSWLPDSIDGLIVGHNSEFNTDELTDEQLERLGGIEYRALRFLGYFVPAVSA